LDTNEFILSGRFAGSGKKHQSPGGLVIQEFELAVLTKISWKEKHMMHFKIQGAGELIKKINALKTGDLIKVKGQLDLTGPAKGQKISLVALEIKKEKDNE
jgi:hypothetical protein